MTALSIQGSDVRINEVNLSASLIQNSNATAALVGVFSKGPLGPTFFPSFDRFSATFGDPNSSVSFDAYMAKDYFAEGNGLWVARAVHSDATYGILAVGVDTSGGAVVNVTTTSSTPTSYPWSSSFTGTQVGMYAFYPKNGPGSFSSNLSIKIRSQNLAQVGTVSKTFSTSGGTLTGSGAIYYYRVAAINASGQIFAAAAQVQQAIAAVTTTGTVTISWPAVPEASGYVIYGRANTPGPYYLTTVGATTLTFTDTGTLVADSTKPGPVSVGAAPISTLFTLEVYDTSLSTVSPVESFECSTTDMVDEMGQAMETSQRINAFSSYLKVVSNVPALLTIPALPQDTITALPAGSSGSSPTSSDINAAWALFSDKQKYVVDVLINAGRATPTVQVAMDTLATSRYDCVAFLDTPSALQTAQNMVDYRNITLNLNSSYSALFGSDLYESDPVNGKLLYVPPSGAMAGLLARTTRVAQPWYSMAGLNRGLTRALDVRYSYTDGEATLLANAQVNYMRKFLGRGIPLWEQWTLSNQSSALQFLNVRVLCNILKRTMYNFLLYSLQEPGDDILDKQIQYGLEEYLRYVQGARGIASSQVVVNSTNNTPALVNSGIRAVAVYIVPILGVRQINLTLQVGKTGLQITEQDIAAFSS